MSYIQQLTKLLSQAIKTNIAGDDIPAYRFTLDQIAEIQNLQHTESIARYADKGYVTQTAAEARKGLQLQLGDDIYNFANGLGTLQDPQQYTQPIMPIMCGAGEASALYAGGGLIASIIDKKQQVWYYRVRHSNLVWILTFGQILK